MYDQLAAVPVCSHFNRSDNTFIIRLIGHITNRVAIADILRDPVEHGNDIGQLRRFEERERVPHKRHKITAEDWRNRARWGAYREAVVERIERTSTSYSPWTIVEAEDKYWGRIKTLYR